MTATFSHPTGTASRRLLVSIEMGWSKIKVASNDCPAAKPRIKDLKARELDALEVEFAKSKARFGLPGDTAVIVCFEAGRDGFWLQRCLTARGHQCFVVDPGSMRVNRRRKRVKTDRIDAEMLLENLHDYQGGNKRVWSVVRVPTLEQEDRRQLHRELETLKGERTEHVNRIKSILATLGLKLEHVKEDFKVWLSEQRLPESEGPVPGDYTQRLHRELERWQLANRQIKELEKEQKDRIAKSEASPGIERIRKRMRLRGIGAKSAWLFCWEIFNWRRFENRRQLGSMAGLSPTAYQSSDMDREMGISKAGNSWLRGMMVEIAWSWLHWQPDSALSKWYMKRFGTGAKRLRKIGIVALARKLLVAIWRWLEADVWPEGAEKASWQKKVGLKTAA